MLQRDKSLITAVSIYKRNIDDIQRLIKNGSNPMYCDVVSYNNFNFEIKEIQLLLNEH